MFCFTFRMIFYKVLEVIVTIFSNLFLSLWYHSLLSSYSVFHLQTNSMEPHYRAHAVYINSLPPSIAISCCLPSSSQLNHLEKEKQVNGCMQSCHITMPPCGYILQKCTRYRAQKGQTPKEEKERGLSIKACTIDQQFSVQRPAHIWVTSQFFHPSPPLLMSEWLGVTGNHFNLAVL